MRTKTARPQPVSQGASDESLGAHLDSMLADSAGYALVVLAGMVNGQTRRRVMFSLPNAQRAVQRCHARGLPASLHLVRLLPVPMADLESVELDTLRGES